MTTFTFSEQAGESIEFDATSDILSITGSVSAASLTLVESNGNLIVTAGSTAVTLQDTEIKQLTTSNIVFADGSELEVGDNNTSTSGDDSANSITTTSDDDLIYGFGGNDTIVAGAGDDIVIAGSGNDSITGGNGADFLRGDEGADTFVIGAGAGADTVRGGQDNDTVSAASATADLYVNGDKGNDSITTGSGEDTVLGGDGDDTISSGADDDSINGNKGDDVITLTGGDDTVRGGQDDDTISVNGAINAEILAYGDKGDDTITFSTNTGDSTIFGGEGADTITGGATADDSINGNQGDDVINGGTGAGDDTLRGGQGADSITGAASDGDDEYYGDKGADTLRSGGGDDTLTGGEGSDVFIVDNLSTDSDDVVITDFTIGTDSLILDIDGASLFVEVDDADDEVTISQGTGATADSVKLENVDGVIVATNESSSARLVINASATAAALHGDIARDGNDGLYGGDGADTLFGYSGDDMLVGGKGNDSIVASSGDDTVDAGEGNDTIDAGANSTGDSIVAGDGDDTVSVTGDAAAGARVLGGEGADTLIIDDTVVADSAYQFSGTSTDEHYTGFETINVTGSTDVTLAFTAGYTTSGDIAATDTVTIDASSATGALLITDAADIGVKLNITGSSSADSINVGDTTTNVVVSAGADADAVITGDGADTITAGTGDDTVNAGAGDDSIVGGTGADSLFGGAGADTLTGGDGEDTFVFASTTDGSANTNGSDVVTDYTTADDVININAASFAFEVATVGALSATNYYEGAAGSATADGAYDVMVLTGAGYADADAAEAAVAARMTAGGEAIVFFFDSDDSVARAYYDVAIETDASGAGGLVATFSNINTLAALADAFSVSEFSLIT